MLHLQGGGDKLSYPGEPQDAEDLDEPEELSPASLPADVAGGPDDDPGVEEEAEVDQLDEDDDALLVDEDGVGEVGPWLGRFLRAQVAVVFTNLGSDWSTHCQRSLSALLCHKDTTQGT